MITAYEAANIADKCPLKNAAIAYVIALTEKKIRQAAEKGYHSCSVDFTVYPDEPSAFDIKFDSFAHANDGLDISETDISQEFNVEKEVKEYFSKYGFTFMLVQESALSSHWEICW